MFGFIRRLARPFGMLGEKIAEVLNIGRKAKPMGVVKEDVIWRSGGDRFLKVDKFDRGRLRPFDVQQKSGGFQGFQPSYFD